MNNKNILRIALPFIIIFFISLLVAGYTYVQQNLSGAGAAEDMLSITAVNTQSPLSTTDQWQWSILASANRRPANPINLTYTVNWCLQQDSTAPCIQNQSEDFFYQLGNGTLIVNALESTVKITHQSINCGRVNVEVLRDGIVIARGAQSTEKQCTRDLANSASAYADSPSDLIDFINMVLRLIFGFLGGDNDSGGNNPGDTNPGGGNPGGDVCTAEKATCQDEYRAACTEGGQAGTQVCYKYGTCSGPGNGVLCSWDDGSFCDPCEAGTKIDDPLPPMKPRQGGGQPGNPGGGQPAPQEPIPSSGDANAQLVVNLADYINSHCSFAINGGLVYGAVNQYNVKTGCLAGFRGPKNYTQTITELTASALSIGADHIRNDRAIGYNHLQCVGFVEGAVATATGREYDGPGGNALVRCISTNTYSCVRTDANNPNAPHQFAPNDMAVWGATKKTAPFGHIAYVTGGNGNVMIVLEANVNCVGCVRSRTYFINDEISNRHFAGWLRRR